MYELNYIPPNLTSYRSILQFILNLILCETKLLRTLYVIETVSVVFVPPTGEHYQIYSKN